MAFWSDNTDDEPLPRGFTVAKVFPGAGVPVQGSAAS